MDGLIDSWTRHLRAAGRRPRTIGTYLESVEQFAGWAHDPPVDTVTTAMVEEWLVHLIDTRSSATARVRHGALRQFFRWATAEGEVPVNPMAELGPPSGGTKVVAVISDADVKRLLDSVDGAKFTDRRDAAILWTLATTGIRCGELVGMRVGDIDLDTCTVTVTGKGDRERTVSLPAKAIAALDRWERTRRRHPMAGMAQWWIGPKGALTDSGVRQLVRRRGESVGIEGLHPHQFRHTFAHRWLAKDGSETGLQAFAGWQSPQMLQRYGASAKAERARAEADRLELDDF